jgi:hypothetical protein
MGITLRRTAVLCFLGLAVLLAATVGAGVARADSGDDTQLVDISKQLGGLQKKLDDLQAHGRWARQGKLAEAADCGFDDPAAVFAPWGDAAGYSLIPGGGLDDLSAWSLKNVDFFGEHDPFTPGSGSLAFNKGDSEAVTPAMCVSLDNPTLRLFLADRGGNGKAQLEVKVLYEDTDGHTHNLTIARLKVGDAWQPSVVIPIGVNMLSVASVSGWTPVAFDFKVHGLQKGETFALDGIYVDPSWSR